MIARFSYAVAILAGSFILTGCQNALFIGQQHAFDLTVEAKNDASEPAKFNFGYESHTAVVAPPKQPLGFTQLFNRKEVAQGDLLSVFSTFSIERTSDQQGNMTVRSGVATGKAATAITDQLKGAGAATEKVSASAASRALSLPADGGQAPGIFRTMQNINQAH